MSSIRRLLLPLAALLALASAAPAFAGSHKPPKPPSSTYAETVLADGPRAYWRLGEKPNTRVAADETGHHPGWYSGDPTLFVKGHPGLGSDRSIDLDGLQRRSLGQFVHVADRDHLAFPGLEPFTLEAWVRPRGRNDVTRRIFSKEGRHGGYLLAMERGNLTFSRYVDDQWSTLATGVDPRRWSHVAATFDGVTMKLYVEGWLSAQGPSAVELPEARADLSIGAKQSRWRFYAGGLDEAAIYPYALTYGQVHAHARAGGGVRSREQAARGGRPARRPPRDVPCPECAWSSRRIWHCCATA